MELSILQFAKDNHPRTVSIGAVVDMIRAGSEASIKTLFYRYKQQIHL